ncbi:LytR/AlgR family response regulator transcription factor [Cellulosimicrobium cellulans]|uniref:LytR/AlgR family response regulator transcription factor n=1 Tax=Cellulosimicrobium cellulans TaxID=1710 RepID=UPI00165208AF|nr:LytTR family DNA-binding domain-containing protein [Cellulosimicrobium cellulans]
MFHIGIVDDDDRSTEVVHRHLQRYQHEHGLTFDTRTFADGWDLVRGYRSDFDILFLDVEMTTLGGFDTARAVRELDRRVVIVFVTRMAQLAIRGYEVDALSYLVKPVAYAAFAAELTRALKRAGSAGRHLHLMLPTTRGTARVDTSDITHVAAAKHHITVHTTGAEFAFTGTLKAVEDQLAGRGFFRCSKSFLVNLRHVVAIQTASCVVLGGHEVPVSRSCKREFLAAVTDHLGGRVW